MKDPSSRAVRTVEEFADMAASVAKAAGVDVVVCVTESGNLFRCLHQRNPDGPLVAATPSQETYDALQSEGHPDVILLPVRVPDRFDEARHAIAMAFQADQVHLGDLAQCVIGQGLFGAHGDFLVLTDVEEGACQVPLHDLVKMTDGVEPSVLDATLEVAGCVGAAAQRGKRVGTIFMLGDSENVLAGSHQLVLNPFQGHAEEDRLITNSAIHDTVIELAKLDGAFVVRGDGLIRTAGTYLETGSTEVEPLPGLGTRHVTAAAVSARTKAIAVVVSATDGGVRVFAGGKLAMQLSAPWTG